MLTLYIIDEIPVKSTAPRVYQVSWVAGQVTKRLQFSQGVKPLQTSGKVVTHYLERKESVHKNQKYEGSWLLISERDAGNVTGE